MNIIRIPKENKERLKNHFQNYLRQGLIMSADSGFAKWRWLNLENPFYLEKNLPCWVNISDNKARGYLGAIPVELKAGSQNVSAAWAIDFITLPEYRGKGVGRSLVEEANNHFDIFFSIGQTDMAASLFAKMGWKLLGHIPYYMKVWNAEPLLRKKIGNPFISRLLAIPINLLLKSYHFFEKTAISENLEIQKIATFGEEADRFWDEIKDDYDLIVPRSRAYLSWKYDRQPGMDYIKFLCLKKNGVRGYIVVRCIIGKYGIKEGLIADIITRPQDKNTIHALIFSALKYLKNKGCSSVRCYMNHKGIEKDLIDCGFLRRRPRMRFLLHKNISGLDETYDLNNWFITAGDCDIDR